MPIDEFLVDSFTTAVGDGEMALAVRFPVPDDRTAGSYQKVERKVGDFATAAAAVQVSLNADGTIAQAGIALSAAGPCAVRVAEAERLLAGQKPTAELIRAAADAASRAASRRPTCAAASNTRSIWPASWWRAACARRWRVWGCRHEGQRHGQRRRLRARRRAANAARLFPARALRPDRHARRLRHLELRLLRRRPGRDDGGQVVPMFAVQADGHEILTVEGLAQGGTLHPLQQGFWDQHGLQCGYCTPGMMLTSYALLKHNPDPSEAEIREGLAGNLCRCTGYQNIVKAVQQAAGRCAAGGRHAK